MSFVYDKLCEAEINRDRPEIYFYILIVGNNFMLKSCKIK